MHTETYILNEKRENWVFFKFYWLIECSAPKGIKMSEHDFKLNVDSLIERLLEGK